MGRGATRRGAEFTSAERGGLRDRRPACGRAHHTAAALPPRLWSPALQPATCARPTSARSGGTVAMGEGKGVLGGGRQAKRAKIHSSRAVGVRGVTRRRRKERGVVGPPAFDGAEGRTRTGMACATRPSNVRVYQFRHFGQSVPFHADPFTSAAAPAAGAHPGPVFARPAAPEPAWPAPTRGPCP